MFRRSNSRDPNLSAYMTDRFASVEEEAEESEEEPLSNSQDYRRPQLDPTSEGMCMNLLFAAPLIAYSLRCSTKIYENTPLRSQVIFNL